MEVQGFADGRFGLVRACLAEILAAQPGTGAAFAAWYDGRLVVDLWGGHADLERHRPWEADSLVQPYSVSKPADGADLRDLGGCDNEPRMSRPGFWWLIGPG